MTTRISDLRVNHQRRPLGLPTDRPLLSWSVDGDGSLAGIGFEVAVGSDPESLWEAPDWRVEDVGEPRVVYTGPEIPPRSVRHWAVRATLDDGTPLGSEVGSFEMGLSPDAWSASEWIAAPRLAYARETWDPAPLLRRAFEIRDDPSHARAYVTALGIYRMWINGEEITASALLRPGWTDYRVRVYHQTFDLTGLLRPGRNVVGVLLGKGWYAGRLGLQREPGFYGDQPALRLQLDIDGAADRVVSDSSWKYNYGAVLSSDILQGEIQDLRQQPPGWNGTDFDDADWDHVEVVSRRVPIHPQPHDHATVHSVREGKLVWEHARGPAIYDFGQNLVGWTRVETQTLPKADVIVRHGEILTSHNLVYRDNLRTAFQEDRYTTGDDGHHVLEPSLTLHGFRYAEVWGLPSRIPDQPLQVLDDTSVSAVVVDAGMEPIGSFECSDGRLNRLSAAVEWTIRDNFIEVITDCPQRDERLGWLGDAGVISRTSAYYFNVAAFVAKFVQDAADAQVEDGTLRSYVPEVPPGDHIAGAPGWADGYVRLVHLLGSRYGDLVSVERHYDSLRRYLARVDADNPTGIRTEGVGSNFGDWLSLAESPDEPYHPLYGYTQARSTSPRQVVATAHTYRSYTQLAEMAEWLGNHSEADRCRQRAEEIRAAYASAFVQSNGTVEGDTQTVYAQALGYELLVGDDARAAAERLIAKIEETGHLTTGIHGTEHVLPVLTRYQRPDLAYALLMRAEMPGWFHMIAQGATTIWEKWDGLASDGTLSTPEMNSFNHCALGAVGQFLFEGLGGVDFSRAGRGMYVMLSPVVDRSLDWVNVSHRGPVGTVESRWRWEGDRVIHDVVIPPLMKARFEVPQGFQVETGNSELNPGSHRLTYTATTG